MEPAQIAQILFGVFGGLLLIGAPISIALGGAAMVTFTCLGQDLMTMIQLAFTSVNSFPIMAVPAFILAGALMEGAGISRRLVAIAELLVGDMPGGLAISTVLACTFFGAISGSGPATAAAVGMLMIPAMIQRGYSPAYAACTAATGGGIGILIPPSLPMVIYGVAGQVSVTRLFLGGVFPGLLLCVAFAVTHRILCRKLVMDVPPQERTLRNVCRVLKEAFWSLLAPVIILGSIYGGYATPTESSVLGVCYTFIVGIFIHKELSWKKVQAALNTTSWMTGRVLIILFTACAFGRILVQYRIPDIIVQGVLDITGHAFFVWAFVIVVLVFLGMFMETLAIILLVTPVLLPVMQAFGTDPVHFGVILIFLLAIGYTTPPMGENMFITSGIADTTIEEVSVRALPFVLTAIIVAILLIAFPAIVLWLPDTLMGAN